MARGALLFGANTTDRAAIGTSTTIGDASTGTILAICRFTGALSSNKSLFGGTPDSATGQNSVVRFFSTDTLGNFRIFVSGSTNLSYITSDTPFSTTGWKYIAATFVFGTSGHIYWGNFGNPKSIAESTYGAGTNNGATKTTAGTAQANVWGNQCIGGAFGRAFLGDVAMGAFFGGVSFSLANVTTWFQRPRVTLGANTATHFGRGGKDGADWIAYAGTSGTITGATQSNGPGFDQGSDLWQQQTQGSPLYTLST